MLFGPSFLSLMRKRNHKPKAFVVFPGGRLVIGSSIESIMGRRSRAWSAVYLGTSAGYHVYLVAYK